MISLHLHDLNGGFHTQLVHLSNTASTENKGAALFSMLAALDIQEKTDQICLIQ